MTFLKVTEMTSRYNELVIVYLSDLRVFLSLISAGRGCNEYTKFVGYNLKLSAYFHICFF
jgi:hypothetical protein